MKALRIHQFGDAEQVVWEEIAEPEKPEGNNVLIAVKAGSLNHLDIWVRRGLPGVPVDLPLVQGCDMAGEVLAVGSDVGDLSVGDRVFLQPGYGCGECKFCLSHRIHYCHRYGIYGETCDGNFADKVIRPSANLIKIPENLSWSEAAALPLVALTAWEMVNSKARLVNDETLLVLGASSGIGTMAVQMGKILGAKVIAITSGTDNVKKTEELGADHVIDRLVHSDFSKQVKELTGKAGADVIFEHTGEATLPQSLRCLGRGGRLVTCGSTTGPKLEVDVQHLFSKQWSLLGSTMGPAEGLQELIPYLESSRLKPVVGKEIPMSEGREAQKMLESGSVFGKIVLNNE